MPEQPRLIKKYPNRRLYDTKTSAYITLSDVKDLVLSKENFNVLDAKTSEDITRSILLQIILEEEAAGMPLVTTNLLAQVTAPTRAVRDAGRLWCCQGIGPPVAAHALPNGHPSGYASRL